MGSLSSHQLLWFLASIYLNPGFETLISQALLGKVGILPSHQLLWFLASIYLDQGVEPLISQHWVPRFYPLGHRVGVLLLEVYYWSAFCCSGAIFLYFLENIFKEIIYHFNTALYNYCYHLDVYYEIYLWIFWFL